MSHPAIVIIGAGVAGLSAALRAAELGATDVTVLERDIRSSGSSALSAGIYNVNATDALNVEVRVRTRERLRQLEAENGLTLNRIGYIRLAQSEAHRALFEQTIEQQRQYSLPETSTMLSIEQLNKSYPHISTEGIVAAIHNPDDGWMDGPQLCAALALRAKALGVKITHRTPVNAVKRGSKRRHRLDTPNGSFEADIVINAAGAWAPHVGDLLGAEVPIVNQLHSVVRIRLEAPLDYVVPMVQEYIPGDDDGFYFRQDDPLGLICGRHTYSIHPEAGSENPDHYRLSVDPAYIAQVAENVSARLKVSGMTFHPGWTGLYPISADGQFQIGPHWSDPSIVLATGFGGNGVTSGVTLGAVAAEWAILGRAEKISESSARALLPDRATLRDVAQGTVRLGSAIEKAPGGY